MTKDYLVTIDCETSDGLSWQERIHFQTDAEPTHKDILEDEARAYYGGLEDDADNTFLSDLVYLKKEKWFFVVDDVYRSVYSITELNQTQFAVLNQLHII